MPPPDTARRHALFTAIEDLVGPEHAETFMSLMPSTPADELVTKDHLKRELENFELRFEAKLHQELRSATRTFMVGLMTSTAATASLCLGAIALVS